MLSAVLWDFGGVITSSPFEAFNAYEARLDIPLDTIRGINATNPDNNAWARLESSQISLDEFDHQFAAEARAIGHDIPGRDVIGMLAGELRPEMVKALGIISQNYKIGCITNNVKKADGESGIPTSSERADKMAEVMAMFDIVVESAIEGIRKPNPAIYTLACERLGVKADEALFLDDLGINLKPSSQP